MTRAFAGALAALALGCAHSAALTPLPDTLLPPLAEPDARLLLIGDAGVEAGADSVLDEAAAWVDAHAAPTAVVFLGDNFYPASLRDAAEVLTRQREVGRSAADVWFVPGNHDWHDHGARLRDGFERERLDALAAAAGDQWKPAPGELGPALVTFGHGLFRVLAIDSERWRLEAAACERDAARCAELRAAEARLARELACGSCAPSVVVAHHPLRTVGEHGGCEVSWLRRAVELGGQDLHTGAYQAYVASLGRALRAHRPILFAAGHDHSLQLARDPDLGAHVVSGAGAKRSPVCGDDGASWSRRGFVSVDFAQGEAPLLRVFAQDDDGEMREVRRERLAQ